MCILVFAAGLLAGLNVRLPEEAPQSALAAPESPLPTVPTPPSLAPPQASANPTAAHGFSSASLEVTEDDATSDDRVPFLEQAEPIDVEPPPTPPSRAAYSVQVAAFSKEGNARQMIRELTAKGYSPYIIEIRTARRASRLHAVRIGRFAAPEEASRTASELRQKEGLDAIVLR